ncbi:tetratricopeptide repeat protein [Marinobacter sp. 1Y8]
MNRLLMMFLSKFTVDSRYPEGGITVAAGLALRGRALLPLIVLMGLSAHSFAAPPPIETIPEEQVLIKLPSVSDVQGTAANETPEQAANRIQQFLQQARNSGDPRFLGYAQRALFEWPDTRITPRLLMLRASLNQSLHLFDDARADLDKVIQHNAEPTLKTQAWLILANLETVQGRYDHARVACTELESRYAGLITASCHALVKARTGRADEAYERLSAMTRDARSHVDRTSLVWAQGTLADIATQQDLPGAKALWQQALALDPDDLYTRAAYTDWLIQHQQPEDALRLTEGYERVDNLAVLRSIALKQLSDDRFQSLRANLEQRFDEARWRGNLLHKRDLARFLLDVENNPEAAFTYAWQNWQTQREPADTALILRASAAANKPDARQTVTRWLEARHQQDARYPENLL